MVVRRLHRRRSSRSATASAAFGFAAANADADAGRVRVRARYLQPCWSRCASNLHRTRTFLLQALGPQEVVKGHIWMKEKAMAQSRAAENPAVLDTHSIICDMEGLGLHVADYEAMQCLRKGIEMEAKNYPETIHQICAQSAVPLAVPCTATSAATFASSPRHRLL